MLTELLTLRFQVGWAQEKLVVAGSSATNAYQKATSMWKQRQQNSAGEVPADARSEAEKLNDELNWDVSNLRIDSDAEAAIPPRGNTNSSKQTPDLLV